MLCSHAHFTQRPPQVPSLSMEWAVSKKPALTARDGHFFGDSASGRTFSPCWESHTTCHRDSFQRVTPTQNHPNWALVSQVNRFEDRDWAGAFAADVGNGVGDGHCDGPETKMPKGDHETQETSPRRGGQKRCPDITYQTHRGTQKTVTANEF